MGAAAGRGPRPSRAVARAGGSVSNRCRDAGRASGASARRTGSSRVADRRACAGETCVGRAASWVGHADHPAPRRTGAQQGGLRDRGRRGEAAAPPGSGPLGVAVCGGRSGVGRGRRLRGSRARASRVGARCSRRPGRDVLHAAAAHAVRRAPGAGAACCVGRRRPRGRRSGFRRATGQPAPEHTTTGSAHRADQGCDCRPERELGAAPACPLGIDGEATRRLRRPVLTAAASRSSSCSIRRSRRREPSTAAAEHSPVGGESGSASPPRDLS